MEKRKKRCANCKKKCDNKFCSRKCNDRYYYNTVYKIRRAEMYHNNREKILIRQKKYDSTHKDIKQSYDKKRWKKRKHKNNIESYSKYNHRDILLDIYNKECAICHGNKNLEIHHKKYSKKIEDEILLCQECHKKIHRKYNPLILSQTVVYKFL
jgi:hypothetical protein